MNSLWNIDFDKIKKKSDTPFDIIREQCCYINEASGGKIIAELKDCSNINIDELHTSSVNEQIKTKRDYQKVLGDIENKEIGMYELYLSSPKTKNYKFRVLFVSYGISIYPAKLLIEKGIAEEIGIHTSVYFANSKDELVEKLEKILCSERVVLIVKQLYSMNLD